MASAAGEHALPAETGRPQDAITAPHIVVNGDGATGRSYALQIRWDVGVGRFWVFRVSANTWRWVRTPQGWRIAERINAPSTEPWAPRDAGSVRRPRLLEEE